MICSPLPTRFRISSFGARDAIAHNEPQRRRARSGAKFLSSWTELPEPLPALAAFVQRLNELGWIDGRTITIEYRWGEGRRERFAEIAGEFVRSKVNVIVTGGSAVPATKQATSVIPIVFILATNPIGGGLIASLSRPGENVTGSSNLGVDLAAKRTPTLLREAVPKLRRLAILANAGYPELLSEMNEVQSTAERCWARSYQA